MSEIVVSTTKVQKYIEKTLSIWAFAIAVCHMLLAAFRYVIPYRNFTVYLQWASLVLLIAGVIYLVVSLIASHESRSRILHFLKKMFTVEQILLSALLLWCIVSCYANGNNIRYPSRYFYFHDWLLFDMAVCVVIFFPMTRAVGFEKAKKAIELLIHIIVVTYSVFTIVCLWHIFHLEVVDLPSGEQAGITVDIQLMLGKHYNLTGMIAATMLFLCVYLLFIQKDRIIKLIYIFFTNVHLFVVYLCNSRTVFLGLLIYILLLGFFLPWYYLKDRKILFRILLSLIISSVVSIIFWCGRTVAFIIFENITHFSEELAAESGQLGVTTKYYLRQLYANYKSSPSPLLHSSQFQTIPINLSTGSSDVRALSEGLSNRENVWIAALKLLASSSFISWFGVTPVEVPEALQSIGGYWLEIAHAHNAILQTGVSFGIPAMGLLIAFAFCVVFFCIRVCIFCKKRVAIADIIMACGVLSILVINIAEPYLIAYFSIISCVFFLYCGYLNELDKVREKNVHTLWNRKVSYCTAIIVAILCSSSAVFYSANYLNINPKRISGSGTSKDPYKIEDKADLEYFRDLINNGNRFKDCYFIQTADIDLQNEEWKPIGTFKKDYYFCGTYEGKGHTIENLLISDNSIKEPKRGALFGYLSGIVSNLSVISGSIYDKEIKIKTDDAIGTNILLGTNRGLVNYNVGDDGYNAQLTESEDGEGITVRLSSQKDKGWCVLRFNDGRSRYLLTGPIGEEYTLSFMAKSNIEGAKIDITHRQRDAKENQIDFGRIITGAPEEWQEYELTGSLLGVEATSQILYFDLRYNPAGTEISIRDLKLEKGDHSTQWSNAPEDTIAVTGRVFS